MIPKLKAPFTIELDIQLTRRLRAHAVLDATGETVFHAVRISEIFTWMLDNDIREAVASEGPARFLIEVKDLGPSPGS